MAVLRGLSCGRVRPRAGLVLSMEMIGERNLAHSKEKMSYQRAYMTEFPSLGIHSTIQMALGRSDAIEAERHWAGNHRPAIPHAGEPFCSELL